MSEHNEGESQPRSRLARWAAHVSRQRESDVAMTHVADAELVEGLSAAAGRRLASAMLIQRALVRRRGRVGVELLAPEGVRTGTGTGAGRGRRKGGA